MDGSGESAYLSSSEAPARDFSGACDTGLGDAGPRDTGLGDACMVDALLMEIAGLLRELIAHDQPGRIDLLELPLSSACVAALGLRLGQGGVAAALNAPGNCQIRETAFPGVWWNSRADETGRLAMLFIEVAVVPRLLRANVEDLRFGHQLLVDAASFNQRRRAG